MGDLKETLKAKKPSYPIIVAFLVGCVIGVLAMIFLPNPMHSTIGNTEENLKRSFLIESAGRSRYLVDAQRAEDEGYAALAALYRAAAQAEGIHASYMLAASGELGNSVENTQAVVENETQESSGIYPQFAEIARHESNTDALRAFTYAAQAEETHAALFADALSLLGTDTPVQYCLCPTCGAIFKDEAPDLCPICGTSGSLFTAYS